MNKTNKRPSLSFLKWVVIAVIAYVVITGWKDIKQGFEDGFRDASSIDK